MDTDKIKYFFPKVKSRLLYERKRLWKYCNIDYMAMRGYKPFMDAAAFKTKLQSMLGSFDAGLLNDINKDERDVILSSAAQTLRHEFDLLGSGPVTLERIDWHCDFKTNTHWKKIFFFEIGFIKGADIKVPWELSRGQHLLWLGEAYLLTGEKKYAQEIIDEINWWIDDNPLMYSVNWTCAMDVAFRAVNWLFSLNMISDFDGFDNQFSLKVTQSLWQHGFFIKKNLEKSIPYSNNHYTSDLVGLLYLGEIFSERTRGKKWFTFGLNELFKEIRIQVLPSGVHYERSVSYHRMMTEMLSYPIYMLHRVGLYVPQDIIERIGRMYAYVSSYTKPNEQSPLVGDNDDGRFLPFVKRDFREHKYLTNFLSVENRFITVGLSQAFIEKPKESTVYQDANVAIIKKNKDYIFINGGGYSRCYKDNQFVLNTHTHNDALSFELALDGEDVIIDPGTYLYTSSMKARNAFRSTIKHNVVVVDEEEQNEFIDAFYVRRNIKNAELKVEDSMIEGKYETLYSGLVHKRRFSLENGSLFITDSISKPGPHHKAVLFFHMAEGITAKLEDNKLCVNNGIDFTFGVTPARIDILDDTLSPSYGIIAQSKTIAISYYFDESLIVETIIKKNV